MNAPPYRTVPDPSDSIPLPSIDDMLEIKDTDLIASWNILSAQFVELQLRGAPESAMAAKRSLLNGLLIVRAHQKQMSLLNRIASAVGA